MLKSFLTLLGIICLQNAFAQNTWQTKGVLYRDKAITVLLEYQMGSDPCSTNGESWKYRYHITDIGVKRGYYINWRFNFFNCDNELKTQLNSLHITADTRTGFVTPDDNDFFAKKMANLFNNVTVSSTLAEVSDFNPTFKTSMEPKSIKGKLDIKQGESTRLTTQGGYLREGDAWKWYEGTCGGNYLGTGPSMIVSPGASTSYFVRAEGSDTTDCTSIAVHVSQISIAASGIDGKSSMCIGEQKILLSVAGGSLADGAKWVWYQDDCNGTAIGEGRSILVSPAYTATYYVRAEKGADKSACVGHQLTVIRSPVAAQWISGPDESHAGEQFVLTVHGGELTGDAKWVWYAGEANNKTVIGSGNSIIVTGPASTQTYAVRAEGACFSSDFVEKKVVIKKQRNASPYIVFINGGITTDDPNNISHITNYGFTLGGGKNIGWYIRAKLNNSHANASSEADYLIGDNYNGQMVSKRTGYTGGVYLGGQNLALYLGGGYGERDLLYGTGAFGAPWVKITGSSFTGAEAEAGLLIKASIFNIMGGASSIKFKYTDYYLGFGLNF